MMKTKKDGRLSVPVVFTTKANEYKASKVVKELMEELSAPVGLMLVRGQRSGEEKGQSQTGYGSGYANAYEEMMARRAKIKQ